MTDPEVARKARRYYEIGRLRGACFTALFALPIVLLVLCSAACGHSMAFSQVASVILITSLVGLLWRGQDYGRGSRRGLLIGSLCAFALCLLVTAYPSMRCCPSGCCTPSRPIDLASGMVGLLGGVYFSIRTFTTGYSWAYVGSGLGIFGVTAALGCMLAGVGSLLGMLLGFFLGALPAVFFLRPSRKT